MVVDVEGSGMTRGMFSSRVTGLSNRLHVMGKGYGKDVKGQ